MGERKLIREETLDFPSNSNRNKEGEERKKLTPVVKGEIIQKEKTFGEKLAKTFFGDDTQSVGDYILHDVLIPAMKSTLSDMVGGGIEMLLFGERRGSSGRSRIYRDRDRSYIPYNRITREADTRRDDRYLSRSERSQHNFNNIIIVDRGEAEDVLSNLTDLIVDYGVASVADYYDLLGIDSNYTDNGFGWTNISDAYIKRVKNGYSIFLPRTRQL